MKVVTLLNKYAPNIVLPELGSELGDGQDGQCFELKQNPDRVIKLSLLRDWNPELDLISQYSFIKKNLDYIISHPNNCQQLCHLFEHDIIGNSMEKTVWGPRNFLVYYSIMEKLEKITEDEYKILYVILSHEDRNLKKEFTTSKLNEIVYSHSKWCEFDAVKIINFYNFIKKSTVHHNDLHTRNIMKNKQGDFKLVDLDRISIK